MATLKDIADKIYNSDLTEEEMGKEVFRFQLHLLESGIDVVEVKKIGQFFSNYAADRDLEYINSLSDTDRKRYAIQYQNVLRSFVNG